MLRHKFQDHLWGAKDRVEGGLKKKAKICFWLNQLFFKTLISYVISAVLATVKDAKELKDIVLLFEKLRDDITDSVEASIE